jgi:hypothetical protein
MIRSVIVCLLALLSILSSASAQSCVGNPVAVQILGSGGPRINPDRASASYLLWIGTQGEDSRRHGRRGLPSLWPDPSKT